MHGMTTFANQPIEDHIAQWRAYLRRRHAVHGPDVEELEGHLRDQLAALTEAGLAGDEAFFVAVKRMGNLDALSREFALAHAEQLWKQLVVAPDTDAPANTSRTELLVVVSLAVAADSPSSCQRCSVFRSALMRKCLRSTSAMPACSSSRCSRSTSWKRGLNAVSGLWPALPFAAAVVFANVFPFQNPERLDNFPGGSDTQVLTVLHLPIALWLMAIGVAYVGGRWFSSGRRMDFVRFSGELAIYYVLIALGGGVVTGFTAMLFSAIDMNPGWFIAGWLIPCGAAGAVIIGSWLVEAKQSVIENMAPVLTRLFTPLFTDSAPWVSGDDGVDRQPDQREAGGPDRFRSAAGRRRGAGDLRRVRARPAGTTRFLRRPATPARGQRARGRCGGADGDRTAHFRVWLHAKPSRRSWRESHSDRQPDVDGVALCVLLASSRLVCSAGAMANRLPPCVCDMGGAGGGRVLALVRLPLMLPTGTAPGIAFFVLCVSDSGRKHAAETNLVSGASGRQCEKHRVEAGAPGTRCVRVGVAGSPTDSGPSWKVRAAIVLLLPRG